MASVSRDRIISVHEAGHAVMGYMLGGKVTLITIEPDDAGGTRGRTDCRLPLEDEGLRAAASTIQQIEYHQSVILKSFAGAMAERAILGKDSTGDRGDWDTVSRHWKALPEQLRVERQTTYYQARAHDTMLQVRPSIEHLANLLINRRTLEGQFAHQGAADACAGVPIQVLRCRALGLDHESALPEDGW